MNLNKLLAMLTGEQMENPNPIVHKEIERIKNELEIIDTARVASIIFRAQAKWVKEGEQNSKYFFSIEKKRYLEKNMASVFINDRLYTDQNKILEAQTDYYESLYKADSTVQFNIQRDPHDPQISVTDKKLCDKQLSDSELFDAMMTLKRNKTPGIDGFTIEFYHHFWGTLCKPLINMYHYAYETKKLPLSTRRGLISLLPKPNKDSRYIKNMRPLTLLNYDYKILAKCLDNRLSPLLHTFINEDQSGFIKGRNISYNIRKSLDVMEYTRKNKIPAVILSCDMEKCFDKIEHEAIYGALRLFNFGEKFVNWIKLFFNDFQVCTQNFGILSNFFDKSRGVNQGCPISPSLFLCAGELLANKIRNNLKIKGIKIGAIEYLLSQFADDTDLYLPFDSQVINAVLDTFSYIQQNIGLTISYDKTVLYRIGSIAFSDAKVYTLFPIKWTNDPINTLGVDLLNRDELSRNFEKCLLKIRSVSNMWYYRNMTLTGKILIVNTLMSSIFTYKMQSIDVVPQGLYAEYDKIVENFLWKGCRSKINLRTLQATKINGGGGLINLESQHQALLMKWMVICTRSEKIANLATSVGELRNITIKDVIEGNLSPQDLKLYCKDKKSFWYNVLYLWCKSTFRTPNCREEVIYQPIRLNSHIRVSNRPIESRTYPPTVGDLISENNAIMSWDEAQLYCGLSWLDYLSLKAAIPVKFVQLLKDLYMEPRQSLVETLLKPKTRICKLIYSHLMSYDVINDAVWRWRTKLTIAHSDMVSAFKNLKKISKVVKLQDFQFRLLHNKIPTNDVLYHWGVKKDQKCEYCKDCSKQTITHLLYSCINSQKLWSSLEDWLDDMGIDFALTEKNTILNNVHPNPYHVTNFLVLVTKQYIYRCKCMGNDIMFKNLKLEINNMREIEKYNAAKNNEIQSYRKKWSIIN